jgi:hypothetical protein
MDMPYNLQTLPSEAIDILRYYGQISTDSAHADAITEGASLSDRSFGKGIRRLVTKNYLVMSSDQVYRLSESGRRVVEELKAYESGAPRQSQNGDARFLRRRLVLVAPRTLPAGQPTEVVLGFDEATAEEALNAPVNMLVRLSVVNGEPRRPEDAMVMLTNQHAQQAFEINAGHFTQARLRVEICQARDDGDDFDFCGGMYVDLPVSATPGQQPLAAFGVDVILKEET